MCLTLCLAIILRYPATGNSYKSLSYDYRVAHNTISLIISDTCEAIYLEYQAEVMWCPHTPTEWRAVAEQFDHRWQFPHAIGSIDGKHIAVKCPPNSGSSYYNYKGFFSILLIAVVDADYQFIYCDVGATGCGSDGGVFAETSLKHALENGTIRLTPDEPHQPGGRPVPYYLLGTTPSPCDPGCSSRTLTKFAI